MTIAAGFIHRDGVLLCSDTLQEGGLLKISSPKIGRFECPGGKFGFAFAGNVRFAICAIQKCRARLANVAPENTIAELESVLDHEYQRLVLQHPDYGKDETIPYWLLISFWQRSSGITSLFVTHEHALQSSFERFQAIGTGFELATVLARPFMYDDLGEEEALVLGAYLLARVKANVAGCGGESQFIALRNDGKMLEVKGIKLDQIAEAAAFYDKGAHELLFSMVRGDDDSFQKSVDVFTGHARALRGVWRKIQAAMPEAQ